MRTPKCLRAFAVWHDNEEQWDPLDIDEPDLKCSASDAIDAAEKLADDGDSSYGTFIVRDEASGEYRRVELVRGWTVKSNAPTTLAELSDG